MFLACHLIAGIVIGIIIARACGDRRAIPACALGALIPDIVDKPLGHIFLAESLGYGRIYLHTLLFLVIVLAIGALIFWRSRNVLVLAAGAGIASHQVLDAMWREPTNWYYPFLGPFSGSGDTTSFMDLVISEISAPSEWLLLVATAIFCLFLFYRGESIIGGRALERILPPLGILLILVGIWTAGAGVLDITAPLTGWESAEDNILCGAVIALSGCAALFFRTNGSGTNP
ncbi:metal-dependent hydrolase [Methanofollis fontis]|uniref:Metal-dependent hydrolase n=1 Tax=Methanofollis fontis TaxID=2052832 RepID=A0A483CQB1_9EURY|nr:metal-dependent hydrolase [Methanofollis fontis]TAJ45303.1 metal-dependent hydrolase [Methanofollis fontis]